MGNDIKGAVGELRFTVEVTRAETGKKETMEMVGYVNQEQFEQTPVFRCLLYTFYPCPKYGNYLVV